MGRANKEQIFFIVSLLLCGWFTWSLVSEPYKKKSPFPGTKVKDEDIASSPVPSAPAGAVGVVHEHDQDDGEARRHHTRHRVRGCAAHPQRPGRATE